MNVHSLCRSAFSQLSKLIGTRRSAVRKCRLGVEQLEDRALPSGVGAILVPAFYHDLLHREPDPGSAGFATQLDNGASPAAVAYQIETAPGNEYRYNIVDHDYKVLLHRQGAPSELMGWAKQLAAGVSDQQLAAMIAGSDEYFALHGSNTAGFLNGLYLDALGRPHSETAFTDAVNQGVARQAVAYNVFNSPEGLLHQVYLDYFQFLGRSGVGDPGALGIADAMVNGLEHERVVAALLGSAEYFTSHAPVIIYQVGGGQIDPYSPAQPDPGQFTSPPPVDPTIPDTTGTTDTTSYYYPPDPGQPADDWTDSSWDDSGWYDDGDTGGG